MRTMLKGVVMYVSVCVRVCVCMVLEHGEELAVDIVIPASCEKDRSLLGSSEQAQVQRDRDNDELSFTLRAISKNAPWVRKIYVLQNSHCKEVWETKKVAEPDKTVWVDRCGFLEANRCPTRNLHVVQSIIHQIRDLSEHFVYTDDDNLLIKPSNISTFFRMVASGIWLPKVPNTHSAHAVYSNPGVTKLLPEQVPKAEGWAHCWQPLLKSAVEDFSANYTDFVNFVRSHWTGRYSSKLNAFGTTESESANSLEEDFMGIWWWWLHASRRGSDVLDDDAIERRLFEDSRIGDWARWQSMFSDADRMILNINDDLDTDTAGSGYKTKHQEAILKLDEAFPWRQSGGLVEKGSFRKSRALPSAVVETDAVDMRSLTSAGLTVGKRAMLESLFPTPPTEGFIYMFEGV